MELRLNGFPIADPARWSRVAASMSCSADIVGLARRAQADGFRNRASALR
jgi:hypothetical protein